MSRSNRRRASSSLLAALLAAASTSPASAEDDAELSADAQTLKDRLLSIDGQKAEAGLRHSIAGRLGTALESVTRLAGFDWRTNIALVGGFALLATLAGVATVQAWTVAGR
jgi:ferrous iron transport protein B